MVSNPIKVTNSICKKIGIRFKTVDPKKLLGADLLPYRTQGHNTKNPIRTNGDKCTSYYKSSIGTGQRNLSIDQIKTIESFIENLELFKKYNN